MTWLESIYPVLKPWLFRLDAEMAHTLTVKMMVISHKLGLLKPLGTGAPVTCMGLTFPNRLGLAAGMDKSASAADAWAALDPQALAAENGVAAALLNGPRYWLMSEIVKTREDVGEKKIFGGIEMLQQATVELSSMNPAPYSVNKVSRRTVFLFGAGRPVFELIDPQGQRWVMQSWSQTVEPTLSLADLPDLGGRLQLPDGWSYRTSVLTSTLSIDTTTDAATVTQDSLGNTYSLAVA